MAGRTVTLALAQGAKTGDTLDLVVTRVTPQAIFAALAQTGNTSTNTGLSNTGRLISFLLTGQPSPGPSALSQGQPLLAAPPEDSSRLAPALHDALAESGLFYESHQARWISGGLETANLQREPQAQQQAAIAGDLPGARHGGANGTPDVVPDNLIPLVHRQLEALASHQLVWQGQVWPGQTMEWEIEEPPDERSAAGQEQEESWNTTLRLTLPRLGGVEAQLHLTPAGVAVRLQADDPAAIEALRTGGGWLSDALAAVDVPLTGMVVEQRK
ncbi:MAG: flagellar hook-length control protein FliK [Zoogloea sp.]|nr:flagellar hook-length control protein FliK [Zoogloea sp.]